MTVDYADDSEVTIEPSALGTQQYWDDFYKTEVQNFDEFGDVGEIWFGKQAERAMVEWLAENTSKEAAIAEFGCGNAHLLMLLARRGFKSLCGHDYSEFSIELALKVLTSEGFCDIKLEQSDLCDPNITSSISGRYDMILDKGTFDAISLCPGDNGKTRKIAAGENYVKTCYAALKEDGLFMITSCNWTEEELNEHFGALFSKKTSVKVSQSNFSFGGQKGSPVQCVVFQKLIMPQFFAKHEHVNRAEQVNQALQMTYGICVPVNGRSQLNQSYAKLRRETMEAKLPKLTRKYMYYIKPKYQRQQRAEQVKKQRDQREFNEKLFLALDMKESGF